LWFPNLPDAEPFQVDDGIVLDNPDNGTRYFVFRHFRGNKIIEAIAVSGCRWCTGTTGKKDHTGQKECTKEEEYVSQDRVVHEGD
jgi:hypothetical protein